MASQEGEAIVKRAPYVDLVFGPQTLHRLPQLLAGRRASGQAQVDISFPEIEKFDHMPPARVEGAFAYVSIMEGCSKYCSYCVVPYTGAKKCRAGLMMYWPKWPIWPSKGSRKLRCLGKM